MTNNQEPGQIKVDLSKIDSMQCFCGCNVFIQIFNLKHLSPIMVGDPRGGSGYVSVFECKKCGYFWPKAASAEDVQKAYDALPSDQKVIVEGLRAEMDPANIGSNPNLEIMDGGLNKGPGVKKK